MSLSTISGRESRTTEESDDFEECKFNFRTAAAATAAPVPMSHFVHHQESRFFGNNAPLSNIPKPGFLQTAVAEVPMKTPMTKPFFYHRTPFKRPTPLTKYKFRETRWSETYRLDPSIAVIEVNNLSQMKELWTSLFESDVIGMSLVRPLEKPWAPYKKPSPSSSSSASSSSFADGHKYNVEDKEEKGGVSGQKGHGRAFLQLACDYDNRVYVVDLECIRGKNDPEDKFALLLGEIFSNPQICKLAYNWSEEGALLRRMFPVLSQRRFHMDNMVDLFYVWIAMTSHNNNDDHQGNMDSHRPSTQYQFHHHHPRQYNHFHHPQHNNCYPKNKATQTRSSSESTYSTSPPTATSFSTTTTPAARGVIPWTSEMPLFPTTMLQPRHSTVSGLLYRLLGKYLKRTSALSWNNWNARPLPPCMQTDLGKSLSAQCLLDMFRALGKARRKDQEDTAEFKFKGRS
ncbi:hypothetical protein BGX23_006027 [Mortierella sp. AD031]|nr:hypothetical protein BGX23_006027 [Mortierella sp. AD031]